MPSRLPERATREHMNGVALITVLLVVAIATILAVGMLRSQFLALQHAAGLFDQDQAWLYTQGAEDFVREVLRQDFDDDKRNSRQVDHPGETWAQPFPPFPVDGGVIHARVSDQQAHFNLNRIWHDNAPDPVAAAIFQRLLKSLGLPDTLVPALTDWIDADNEATGSDGAEDDMYSRLDTPYRVANQPISDISELRLIKGFTPEIIAKLRPYVCALPATALLNINTADPVTLAALTTSMTSRNASELSSQRPSKGYASVDEFLAQPVFNGLDATKKTEIRQQIDVRSHYFQLLADAEIAGRHSMVLAVIARGDSGTLNVIARDFSQKFAAPAASAGSNSGTNNNSDPTMDSAVKAARDLL
ncbi:MAG: type II secretion system minor pseudopilin GspK [bacterium]|nr:type II secretion system minor pseudopilin GspK [bacterium]